MHTYRIAVILFAGLLAAQPSSRFRRVDSFITDGVRNAQMFAFQPKIPSTLAERTLTATVGATLTFTTAMGGCPWGVNGADANHYLYISGGTGTAEAVLITGGTCTGGVTSGTVTFTPANNHSGAWTIQSATGGIQEAIADAGTSGVVWVGYSSYTSYAKIYLLNGQRVKFSPGTHTLMGIVLPDSTTAVGTGAAVEGSGQKVTTIQLKTGANTDLVMTASFYTIFDQANQFGSQNMELANATFDGNKSNQTITEKTITNCTNATPIVCTTSANHNYSSGDVVSIKGVYGNLAANGVWPITVTGATTFSLANSIGLAAWTSGGTVTNSRGNCLVHYGRGPIFRHVAFQNCIINGIVSGWAVEPATGYLNVNDKINSQAIGVKSGINDYHGMVWHGPHEVDFNYLDLMQNKGWQFINFTSSAFSGVFKANQMQTYGDQSGSQGGIFDNGGLSGSDITGSCSNAAPAVCWGMYVAPYGGGASVIAPLSVGGGIPLEINASTLNLTGYCGNNTTGNPCIKFTSGYGNVLKFTANVSTNYFLKVVAETGGNTFHARVATAGGAGLIDPAGLPAVGDNVDITDLSLAHGEMIQQLYHGAAGGYTYAQLTGGSTFARSQAGDVVYCTDCSKVNPCAASGSGAWAHRIGSQWDCGSTASLTYSAGQDMPHGHVVSGSGTLSGGTLTVTLSNGAVFTNTTSYSCTVSNTTSAANGLKIVPVSGTQFTVTGTGTDSFWYICVGN